MLLAYVLVFLLNLTASTCHATSRNQHLLFAGRRAADDAATLLPAAIHHYHHGHMDKAEVLSVSDYNDDVRHYHPAMMARWGGGTPPRPPSTSSPSVELAGIGGAPPPPSLSAVESSGVEGAPPPPRKQDTSAAIEPSSPDASATEHEASAVSGDVDVDADYDGPMTHPPSHN